MTAYEILEELAAAGLGSQPPVAYRALDFLVANGLAHRIERLGAFAACTHAEAAHNAGFLICRVCRRVAETPLPRPAGALVEAAAATGFSIERTVMEAEGLCARCREAGRDAGRDAADRSPRRGHVLRRAPGARGGRPRAPGAARS